MFGSLGESSAPRPCSHDMGHAERLGVSGEGTVAALVCAREALCVWGVVRDSTIKSKTTKSQSFAKRRERKETGVNVTV